MYRTPEETKAWIKARQDFIYEQGRQACRDGKSTKDNPFPWGYPMDLRHHWKTGWYDEAFHLKHKEERDQK